MKGVADYNFVLIDDTKSNEVMYRNTLVALGTSANSYFQ